MSVVSCEVCDDFFLFLEFMVPGSRQAWIFEGLHFFYKEDGNFRCCFSSIY